MITTKARYAVVIMADISHAGKVTSIIDIAMRQSISQLYIEQILLQLEKKTLVKKTAKGYKLAAAASTISLQSIIDTTQENARSDQDEIHVRLADDIWKTLDKHAHDYLSTLTLADIKQQE